MKKKTPAFSILHTSARPDKWRAVYEDWMSKAVHPEDVEYVLCVDPRWNFSMDPKAYDAPYIPRVTQDHLPAIDNLHVCVNNQRRCYVDGVNIAARESTGDILIVNADDQFAAQNWDERLIIALSIGRDRTQLTDSYVIEVSTGTPQEHERGIMVMPILSRSRYEQLGFVFYPEYESMFADNDFAEHARQDGVVIDARHLMFPHRHPINGQAEDDQVYRTQARLEAWGLGEQVLSRRRAGAFLSVPPKRMIALCLSGEMFRGEWVDGLLALWRHLLHELDFSILKIRAATSNVYATREALRREVMKADPKPDLVLWLDDDNILSPEQFDRLLGDVDAHPEVDGVAGWCWIHDDKKRSFMPSCGNWAPDHAHWSPFQPSFMHETELRSFEAGGLPVMLMRRSALEKAGEQCFLPVIDDRLDTGMMGEDTGFFLNAGQGGAKFLVDPRVRVPHLKWVEVEPVFPEEGLPPVRVAGMIRAKNEARWIHRAIQSLKPLCDAGIFVLDDESDDETAAIALEQGATVWSDPFPGQPLDEPRDKNWMLARVRERAHPDWIMCIDGDEELEPTGAHKIRSVLQSNPTMDCFALRFLFLWDSPNQIRVDRWYSTNVRQSLFRPIEGAEYKSYYHGDPVHQGLHTSNAPHDLAMGALQVALLHYGYMFREDRIRKYEYYNRIDPGNKIEDEYRHMVQGDVPEVPKDAVLKYAGPLELRRLPASIAPKWEVPAMAEA